jgi:uncharacterized protein HemX
MPKRYKRNRAGSRLFLIILCLAGLGVGVWLFGRRQQHQSEWADRRDQNGRSG